MQLAGLHHVTCVCSDAQRTLDFYRDRLGFTLVKKTVNFDDPHSYHLYFGDERRQPGHADDVLRMAARRAGQARTRDARVDRARDARSSARRPRLEDPDGLRLRLYPAETPRLARRRR